MSFKLFINPNPSLIFPTLANSCTGIISLDYSFIASVFNLTRKLLLAFFGVITKPWTVW